MIEVERLCKYYGPFVAVRDISFRIPAGQIVALLGPNGAGKTTIMRMLAGYMAPSRGSAWIAGRHTEADRLAVAAVVGYLPENGPLYPDQTPLEVLRFFGEARGMSASFLRSRIDFVVEYSDIRAVLNKQIGRLSKGLRQRVSLALVLIHNPPVLIMDEPTAGLDPNQIRQFRKNILELRNDKTILISTHILQEVEAIADRAIVIDNGRIVADASTFEFLSQGPLDDTFYRLTQSSAAPRRPPGRIEGVDRL
jgi:ABC-2 type transport system ATP-binding protein